MKDNLLYDGTLLHWMNAFDAQTLSYKATSGIFETDSAGKLKDYRNTAEQCTKDKGPVPEGKYEIEVIPRGEAGKSWPTCSLVRPKGGGIQTIPRGANAVKGASNCEPYWANWGVNRVQMNPANEKTRTACSPRRTGFYIHDSAKGFSHGCIEVEADFFVRLRKFASLIARKKMDATMPVTVAYRSAGMATYGYTDQPNFVGPIP